MFRHLATVFVVSWIGVCSALGAQLEKLQLLNGSSLEGEPISFDVRGVVVKLASGEFAPREGWTNFTQAALKQLMAYPKAKPFAEPLIDDETDTEAPKRAAVQLELKPVPRLDRPNPKTSSLFGSPLSVLMLFAIYLANVYAGFAVARYRKQPPGLVCGISAVAPLAGPIIFLCMPTRVETAPEEQFHAPPPPQESAAPESAVAPAAGDVPGAPAAIPAAPAAAAPPPPTIYRRPQTTFNRRFFETKLAGFLRVVPGDAEKDMVICVASSRGNYVGQRIVRIMPNELLLLVKKGDATSEVIIPFNEINEVQVRHQDA